MPWNELEPALAAGEAWQFEATPLWQGEGKPLRLQLRWLHLLANSKGIAAYRGRIIFSFLFHLLPV